VTKKVLVNVGKIYMKTTSSTCALPGCHRLSISTGLWLATGHAADDPLELLFVRFGALRPAWQPLQTQFKLY